MLGIVAADCRVCAYRLGRFAVPVACGVLVVAIVEQVRTPVIDHGDPLWHLAAFALVVAADDAVVGSLLRWKPLAVVGAASYSLYLVHQPVLWSLEDAGVPPAASLVVSLACGFAFFCVVERPLFEDRVRQPLERWILGRIRRCVPGVVSSSSAVEIPVAVRAGVGPGG